MQSGMFKRIIWNKLLYFEAVVITGYFNYINTLSNVFGLGSRRIQSFKTEWFLYLVDVSKIRYYLYMHTAQKNRYDIVSVEHVQF